MFLFLCLEGRQAGPSNSTQTRSINCQQFLRIQFGFVVVVVGYSVTGDPGGRCYLICQICWPCPVIRAPGAQAHYKLWRKNVINCQSPCTVSNIARFAMDWEWGVRGCVSWSWTKWLVESRVGTGWIFTLFTTIKYVSETSRMSSQSFATLLGSSCGKWARKCARLENLHKADAVKGAVCVCACVCVAT